MITEPTRITEDTETLLDHIYVSSIDKVNKSGVIHTGLSDHSLVYLNYWKSKKISVCDHKYKTCRTFKRFNDDNFLNDIRKVNWNQCKLDDVHESAKLFENMFASIADKHAPLKSKRVRKKTVSLDFRGCHSYDARA